MPTETAETNNGAASAPTAHLPAKKEDVTVIVAKNVRGYLEKGTLVLPQDYAVENAIKSAYLAIQEVKDMNGKPALEVCTQVSVMNALLDMVVQGMNPMKKQCYFIVYGKSLTMQRSYFGEQVLAKRVKPNIEFYYDVVRQGDILETETVRGCETVAKHIKKIENINNPIIAAYCGLTDTITGQDLGIELMSMSQIEESWKMSKTYKPENKNGIHARFDKELCLRTVIRKRAKPIINASDDAELLKSIMRQAFDRADAQMDEEVEANANGEVIDIEAEPTPANPNQPEQAEQAAEGEQPGEDLGF